MPSSSSNVVPWSRPWMTNKEGGTAADSGDTRAARSRRRRATYADLMYPSQAARRALLLAALTALAPGQSAYDSASWFQTQLLDFTDQRRVMIGFRHKLAAGKSTLPAQQCPTAQAASGDAADCSS